MWRFANGVTVTAVVVKHECIVSSVVDQFKIKKFHVLCKFATLGYLVFVVVKHNHFPSGPATGIYECFGVLYHTGECSPDPV